ncbi:hypothetical protein [Halobacillus sp. A5]|uniref:hypothetical protein n=1 Tax=Halobacillus sp. A5 TaxID=2880263 RepID=UPI0020A64316|nr:hypothetical protein [Halobacillus sp. A5]MCP3028507.1 hypothetical protein [Halobacillus sp. A5]
MRGIVVDKRKYKMAIQEQEKELCVQVFGLIRADDAEEYLADLQETVSQVPKNSYTLVIDGTHQTTVPSKVVPQLDQTLQFYMNLGFKDIKMIYPSSKIAQVQLRNALERVQFHGDVVSQ